MRNTHFLPCSVLTLVQYFHTISLCTLQCFNTCTVLSDNTYFVPCSVLILVQYFHTISFKSVCEVNGIRICIVFIYLSSNHQKLPIHSSISKVNLSFSVLLPLSLLPLSFFQFFSGCLLLHKYIDTCTHLCTRLT